MKSAVCFFAYKRVDKVERTLSALAECMEIEDTPICIFQDSNALLDKDDEVMEVMQVEKFIKDFIIKNPKLHIEYSKWKKHAGADISLTRGMQYALNKYGKAIRIEEDIEVRKDFLVYMNNALDFYENNPSVFGICSYNPGFNCMHETFLAKIFKVWGFGTWKSRFDKVNWNKAIVQKELGSKNSENLFFLFPYSVDLSTKNLVGMDWDFTLEDRMIMYHCFINNLLCVYSNTSFSKNIGFDGSGVHSGYNISHNHNFERKPIQLANFDNYILNEQETKQLILSTLQSYHKDFIY